MTILCFIRLGKLAKNVLLYRDGIRIIASIQGPQQGVHVAAKEEWHAVAVVVAVVNDPMDGAAKIAFRPRV